VKIVFDPADPPVTTRGIAATLDRKGYQQIAAATTVAATPLTVPTQATIAIIQAEAQDARWRDDGVDPTASVGMILKAGEELVVNGADHLAAIKFINKSAGAILNISYYA